MRSTIEAAVGGGGRGDGDGDARAPGGTDAAQDSVAGNAPHRGDVAHDDPPPGDAPRDGAARTPPAMTAFTGSAAHVGAAPIGTAAPAPCPRRPADAARPGEAAPSDAAGRLWQHIACGPLRPLAWLALQLQLLVLLVPSIGWNALALLLHPLLPRALGRRVGRAAIAHGYGFFWALARRVGMLRLDSSALDALRREHGGLVVVANHPSMLDAVMLVARLPRAFCIMKASLAHNPLLGPGARLARYIRNDSLYRMIQRSVDELRDGGQLVLFPEGTRTVRAPLNPLHASFAFIAHRAGVPVQTVFIDTVSPYLGKGWPIGRLPPLPIRFSVRLGPRFDSGGDPNALAAAVEACLRDGVQPLPHRP